MSHPVASNDDPLVGRVPHCAQFAFRTAVGPGTIVYPSISPVRLRGLAYRVIPNPPHKSFTFLLVDRLELDR